MAVDVDEPGQHPALELARGLVRRVEGQATLDHPALVELGAVPSTGTVGDSFDNAMAEAVNNLYKTELIRQRGPWRTVEQVELATLEWVWWWNNQRLHGELDLRTQLEVENAYYADLESAQPASAGQTIR